MSMLSICSNFAIYASLCLYYVTVFSDICTHMNLPLLNTVTNVYCDGVFDCLHRGQAISLIQTLTATQTLHR